MLRPVFLDESGSARFGEKVYFTPAEQREYDVQKREYVDDAADDARLILHVSEYATPETRDILAEAIGHLPENPDDALRHRVFWGNVISVCEGNLVQPE